MPEIHNYKVVAWMQGKENAHTTCWRFDERSAGSNIGSVVRT